METALKRAIEAGWPMIEGIPTYPEIGRKKAFACMILLDPAFWQALGKAEGWPTAEREEMRGIEPNDVSAAFGWLKYWHRFLDHLASGKSADEFFEEIIK